MTTIRLAGSTILVDERPVATILPDCPRSARDDLAELVEVADYWAGNGGEDGSEAEIEGEVADRIDGAIDDWLADHGELWRQHPTWTRMEVEDAKSRKDQADYLRAVRRDRCEAVVASGEAA